METKTPPKEMTNFAFIGDVHSDRLKLEQLLNKIYNLGNYEIVFLGDIFDYGGQKRTRSDPNGVLKLIQSIPRVRVLNSNHQEKLKKYLLGRLVHATPPLQDTINKLDLRDIESLKAKKMLSYLSSLPYFLDIEADGIEYKLAHAYYSRKLLNSKEMNSRIRNNCLYGPSYFTVEGARTRTPWWLADDNKLEGRDKTSNYVRVAGHYHIVYKSKSSVILDGSCGYDNEYSHLVAYLTDKKEIISTAPTLKIKEICKGHYEYTAGQRPTPRPLSLMV